MFIRGSALLRVARIRRYSKFAEIDSNALSTLYIPSRVKNSERRNDKDVRVSGVPIMGDNRVSVKLTYAVHEASLSVTVVANDIIWQ